MLLRLRTMSEAQLEALPYGSEGLWRKLMHAIRECARLEDILEQVKSKRYTRTRLDRMVMCAYLGITREQLETPAPYVRVLGLNERGGKILRLARQTGTFYNAGQTVDGPYWEQERQRGSLYGLFARENRDPADPETERRVVYLP